MDRRLLDTHASATLSGLKADLCVQQECNLSERTQRFLGDAIKASCHKVIILIADILGDYISIFFYPRFIPLNYRQLHSKSQVSRKNVYRKSCLRALSFSSNQNFLFIDCVSKIMDQTININAKKKCRSFEDMRKRDLASEMSSSFSRRPITVSD